jgi:hypothetical protein
MRELFIERAIRPHAVVHAPGQFTNFRMQCAAHGHVEFLKAPANAQNRLPGFDAGADQGKRHAIPAPVECAMGFRGLVAVFLRMHIGPPAGKQKPVTDAHDLVDIDAIG